MNVPMPVLFVGHGSPMNAVADNAFTQTLARFGRETPSPRAICVVSAHWVTRGTEVLTARQPRTIHDFYGFPRQLYEIQYAAPGASDDASALAREQSWRASEEWGFDHGTWSVLRHLYPAADVPVFQVSLDASRGLRDHLALGEELRALRNRGVLLVGSGNIVHNLRRIDFDAGAAPYDWAVEFDARVAAALQARDAGGLISEQAWGAGIWAEAHPTVEHYLPLLYCFGASSIADEVTFPHVGIEHASISMRMVRFGA